MGTSAAPWAHRVLSPCSYRFNTPSIISPLLILPGRACSALRLQLGPVSPFAFAKNGAGYIGLFLETRADIVALAGERWRQLKPRRNFLRIVVRRGGPRACAVSQTSAARARNEGREREGDAFCSLFYIVTALWVPKRFAATFIHVTVEQCQRSVEEKHCR